MHLVVHGPAPDALWGELEVLLRRYAHLAGGALWFEVHVGRSSVTVRLNGRLVGGVYGESEKLAGALRGLWAGEGMRRAYLAAGARA